MTGWHSATMMRRRQGTYDSGLHFREDGAILPPSLTITSVKWQGSRCGARALRSKDREAIGINHMRLLRRFMNTGRGEYKMTILLQKQDTLLLKGGKRCQKK